MRSQGGVRREGKFKKKIKIKEKEGRDLPVSERKHAPFYREHQMASFSLSTSQQHPGLLSLPDRNHLNVSVKHGRDHCNDWMQVLCHLHLFFFSRLVWVTFTSLSVPVAVIYYDMKRSRSALPVRPPFTPPARSTLQDKKEKETKCNQTKDAMSNSSNNTSP